MGKIEKIGLGGSCHWCTEAIFQSLNGVTEVLQDWVASTKENATYSEAVLILFDSTEIHLENLLEIHLHTHSCTVNHTMREKYRSALYYEQKDQKEQFLQAIDHFQKDFTEPILTKALPLINFKLNDEKFLNYYFTNPEKPFCENVINPKLKLLLQKFKQHVMVDKLAHLQESNLELSKGAIG